MGLVKATTASTSSSSSSGGGGGGSNVMCHVEIAPQPPKNKKGASG